MLLIKRDRRLTLRRSLGQINNLLRILQKLIVKEKNFKI